MYLNVEVMRRNCVPSVPSVSVSLSNITKWLLPRSPIKERKKEGLITKRGNINLHVLYRCYLKHKT